MLIRGVQVEMDRFMGSVTNELATITGLELTVAPRRPAHMTHKCAHKTHEGKKLACRICFPWNPAPPMRLVCMKISFAMFHEQCMLLGSTIPRTCIESGMCKLSIRCRHEHCVIQSKLWGRNLHALQLDADWHSPDN